MGVSIAEYEHPPPVSSSDHYFAAKPDLSAPPISTADPYDPNFLPCWARYSAQSAQNLLDCSDEPIEYDHDDADYHDNSFFFPEDCSWTPPKDWVVEAHRIQVPQRRAVEQPISLSAGQNTNTTDTMIPGLPDIKMLDSEALGDLLDDNLSPPEITTILYVARELSCPRYSPSDSSMLTFSSQRLRNQWRRLRLRLLPLLSPAAQPKRNLRRRLHLLRKERLDGQPHRRQPGQPPILICNRAINVTRRRGINRFRTRRLRRSCHPPH